MASFSAWAYQIGRLPGMLAAAARRLKRRNRPGCCHVDDQQR
jgi:hypothetical protein